MKLGNKSITIIFFFLIIITHVNAEDKITTAPSDKY